MNKSRSVSFFLDDETIQKITKLKEEGKIISRAEFIRNCIEIVLKKWDNIEIEKEEEKMRVKSSPPNLKILEKMSKKLKKKLKYINRKIESLKK